MTLAQANIKNCTYALSRDIIIPNEVLLFKDTNCSIHNQDIDSFYNSIISVFKQATIECISSSNNCNKKFIPFLGGMNMLESITKLQETHSNGGT